MGNSCNFTRKSYKNMGISPGKVEPKLGVDQTSRDATRISCGSDFVAISWGELMKNWVNQCWMVKCSMPVCFDLLGM